MLQLLNNAPFPASFCLIFVVSVANFVQGYLGLTSNTVTYPALNWIKSWNDLKAVGKLSRESESDNL